ncbi:hypothetical protein Shyhy02_35840 [Streptomyces hygroscopicus subsp. hygroscopicus]|nr:hypothetical protein Shyhy02_35840 [Streptomyces hygroscopicus subsp. hygroscopicus]
MAAAVLPDDGVVLPTQALGAPLFNGSVVSIPAVGGHAAGSRGPLTSRRARRSGVLGAGSGGVEHHARVLAGDAEDVAGQDQGTGLRTAGGCPRGTARGEVVRAPGVEDATSSTPPSRPVPLPSADRAPNSPPATGQLSPAPEGAGSLPWGRGRCFAAPAGALCPHISPSADWGQRVNMHAA